MNEIDTLANQKFLEWESRLHHIDEVMAKAHAANANGPSRPDVHTQLANIKQSRDALAQGLASASSLSATDHAHESKHADGLKASFEAIGLELERVFASIVGSDSHT